MTDTYDLVVIGAGPGGLAAAELAAHFGHRAIIVEKNKPGGVVTTTGGAPTKTLREAALYLTGFHQSEVYGVEAAVPLEVARPAIRRRTTEVCQTLQGVVTREIAESGVSYLKGTARLVPHRSVVVSVADGSERRLTAGTILIATGSRPMHFEGIPFDDPDIYDSDSIFSLRRVPTNVVVVGGGPIGVEFTTVFTALRIPVTLVDHGSRLLPAMDGELVDLLVDELKRRGVSLINGAGATSVVRRNGHLTVALSNGTSLESDTILFAAGRRPNTENLGLEDVGVALDARGRIAVDRYYRTTADGIYAVGDVLGPTLASVAMQQGRSAACHALGMIFGIAIDQASSSAVYGVPEIAGVGATEEQLREAGVPYVVGRCDLAKTARGAISGHGGLLKLLVRVDNRKLLGVHCIGDIASELVGLGHAMVHLGTPVDIFLMLALNTPTYSYAYRDAAIDGLAHLAEVMGLRKPISPMASTLAAAPA
jgi:NAD(P) transhydrogenase